MSAGPGSAAAGGAIPRSSVSTSLADEHVVGDRQRGRAEHLSVKRPLEARPDQQLGDGQRIGARIIRPSCCSAAM